ncbi:biotin--[acetyl-CoA-carboxylase] ligase [Candidatus Nitrospira neomarina]|uniref:Biotin--[acetyl-CoA-carboxylase] ligase n=1 Tax=Candidatus Nitrospira neomarina TaxID=3020899 RepID=A0AA96GIF9_9BACT|nr:biotin--[acetyl-CoA-carboxylase] ligase [Candidatus Nitrospira neomarina]WNM62994.1 biotin--[acetyl-CoA-carboxylase] ligase [Candidatus Nitrospira neomarina]
MLSSTKLAALLPSKKFGDTLYIFDELDSTNAFAVEKAKTQALSGTVILADRQIAGRGRLDRSWFSPGKSNIYGSLLFVHETPIQYLGWVPLMAGVAIAQALEQQTSMRIDLKWPNDLLIGGRKLGGILCDSFRNPKHHFCVVIGFGINVNLTPSEFPSELQTSATSLQIHCHCAVDREELIMKVIASLEKNWENLRANGPLSYLVEYTHWCVTIGQTIQVRFPDGSQLQGLAHSIGEDGQLRLIPSPSDSNDQSARMRDIHSGEILHLRTTA